MATVLGDLRFALRTLRRSPGFTAVAVLTLALGVGANSLLFSVIHAVLLRPLPYPDPDRIVSIGLTPLDQTAGRQLGGQISHWTYFTWRDGSHSLSAWGAYRGPYAIRLGGSAPEVIWGAEVTPGFFALLGVQPALGRAFTSDEYSGGVSTVVLVSHGLWQRRFGAARDVVGQVIALDGAPATIVGVLPAAFDFPSGVSVWQPMMLLPTRAGPRGSITTMFLHAFGRLAPRATLAQARSELAGLLPRSADPGTRSLSAAAVDVATLHERLYGNTRPMLLVLLGAVGFVLLIACANVANLLLARAAVRQQEFAIRLALGASRARAMRQVLVESLALAGCGAGIGLLVPVLGLPAFLHAAPLAALSGVEIHVDVPVLAFTAGLALVTGLAFGIAPALAASAPNLMEALKSGGRPSSPPVERARLRKSLVVAQLAAALVLLVGAGLMTRTLFKWLAVDLGVDPDHVIAVQLGRPANSRDLWERGQSALYAELPQRLGALPGVTSVALADGALPLGGFFLSSTVHVDDQRAPTDGGSDAAIGALSPEYFRTLGLRVIAGRPFSGADRFDAAPVAIVNAAFARRFLRGADPVGHQVGAGGEPRRRTIVGEVEDVLQVGRDLPATPEVYLPVAQAGNPPGMIALRTIDKPERLLAAVRRAVGEIVPEQLAPRVYTLESELAKSTVTQRDQAALLGAFAVVAMALAAVGVAGVTAYLVTRRSHEIGVRLALGAGRGDVLRLVSGEGLRLVALGTSIGLVAAVGLARLLEGLLFGVTAADPLTFLIVPLVLAMVALGASIVPARRAARVDPMATLRSE